VEWLEQQVELIEQEIERRVAPLEEVIRRLVTIPGIERKTAWTIVAESGPDLRAFPDAERTSGQLERTLSRQPREWR
jgi:transposase